MKTSISLLLSMLLLASCGKSSSGGAQSELAARPVQKNEVPTDDETVVHTATLSYSIKRRVELEADMSNLETFKEKINLYSITAQVTSGHYQNSQLVCAKLIFDQTKSEQKVWFDNQGQSASLLVEVGENDPVEAKFNCYVNYLGEHTEIADLRVLKSFVIKTETSLEMAKIADTKKIGTLVLEEGAILSSEGKEINLEVQELIAQKGVITTYTQNNLKQKTFDVNGESGGVLNLKINKAIGEFKIEMKGRSGGDVTSVRAQKSAPAANPALNGNCRGEHSRGDTRCMGKAGGRGFDGEPGYNGFVGGNTGKLNLEILEKENLKLEINFYPGEGSKASPDTNPTAGQPGGIGSSIEWRDRSDCRPGGGPGGGGPRGVKSGSLEVSTDFMNTQKTNNYSSGRGFAVINAPACSTERYKFPNGAQGASGNPVPESLKAQDGVSGNIEMATLILGDEEMKLEIDQNWKNF